MQQQDDQRLINTYIAEFSARGYIVVSQTHNSAQMKKTRQWSRAGLILSAVLLLCFGTGLIVLLLTVIDYLIQSDQRIFFTSDDIRAGKVKLPPPATGWNTLVVIGVTLALAVGGCTLLAVLGGMAG